MKKIYDRIKSLLQKKVSDNNSNTDEQPKRSPEKLATLCKSKSLVLHAKNCIREVWLLYMEPYM